MNSSVVCQTSYTLFLSDNRGNTRSHPVPGAVTPGSPVRAGPRIKRSEPPTSVAPHTATRDTTPCPALSALCSCHCHFFFPLLNLNDCCLQLNHCLCLALCRPHISLSVRINSSEGLLFHAAGQHRAFMSLSVSDGHMLLVLDGGKRKVSLRSRKKYNDDQWHTVRWRSFYFLVRAFA